MSELRDKLIDAYMQHIVQEGEKPKTVFSFCKSLDVEEPDFYAHFPSFESIEIHAWKKLFSGTIDIAKGDEAFEAFSARERYLAFQFTLIEQFKKNLSYYRLAFGASPIPTPMSSFAKGLNAISPFVDELLAFGEETDEIASRPFFKKFIQKGIQMHVVFVIKYFFNDTSEGFEKTDQAIEKSTHLLFDGLSKGVIDSAFDFAKFMGQNAFA